MDPAPRLSFAVKDLPAPDSTDWSRTNFIVLKVEDELEFEILATRGICFLPVDGPRAFHLRRLFNEAVMQSSPAILIVGITGAQSFQGVAYLSKSIRRRGFMVDGVVCGYVSFENFPMLNELEGGVRLTEAQTGHRLPPSVGHYIWDQIHLQNPDRLYFVRKSPKKENFEAKLRMFGLVREINGIQVIQHKKKKNKWKKRAVQEKPLQQSQAPASPPAAPSSASSSAPSSSSASPNSNVSSTSDSSSKTSSPPLSPTSGPWHEERRHTYSELQWRKV